MFLVAETGTTGDTTQPLTAAFNAPPDLLQTQFGALRYFSKRTSSATATRSFRPHGLHPRLLSYRRVWGLLCPCQPFLYTYRPSKRSSPQGLEFRLLTNGQCNGNSLSPKRSLSADTASLKYAAPDPSC